ncbi:transporter [Frateuria aurantia]|uniref:EamA-like transporter family n=1 Tax=Frateuria aurantia (strain ATCC 33424 / DSM 6220 / KCTC 2777 / LMG 1558 / NBRC 3245 / NCIMB 13370) TaxID=767434 RepID=H8KZP9_FRAAD|nr:transporter [Frateuria aurantia]AFC84560.1 EamA-like transporter family [Frateuria aurantia DSM 6220]
MIPLLLSVLFSVAVSALLKLAPARHIDLRQAIGWNYLAAAGLSAWLLHPSLDLLHQSGTPWLALAALGVLLPAVFWIEGLAVQRAGMIRVEVAQRFSLLLSLLAAFAWLHQPMTTKATIGVVLGLSAVGCMLGQGRRAERTPHSGSAWLALLGTWLGFGLIDLLFKQVAAAGAPFTSSLLVSFLLAALLAAIVLPLLAWRGRLQFGWRHAGAGLLLGLCNYANIYFYVRAHIALPHNPALVFAGMNLGVIMLGSLVAAGMLGERLSLRHLAGLGLAAIAIGCLA